MKKFYFAIIALFACLSLSAQTVFIDQNPGTSGNVVIGQSTYHVSESIYTDAEIGSGNFTTVGTAIQELYFVVSAVGANPVVNNYSIYLKDVPAGTTTFTTGAYSTAGYTLVYNGSLDASFTGTAGVTLIAPYVRTAGTNLQMLLVRNDNVLHTGFIMDCAVGNNIDVNAASSRRYNSTTAPVSGVTSLTATNFRPTIALVHKFPVDAGVVFVAIPGTTCFSGPITYSVILLNDGLNPIAAGAANVTLKIGGANTFTASLANTAVIAPDDFEVINFSNVLIPNPGVNDDTIYVNLPGDGTTYNDTLITQNITASTLSTFPVVEDAEAPGNVPFTVFNYAEAVELAQLWTVQTGNYTNPDMTLPLVPRAPGNQFYLFDSYSGANSTGTISRLFSNCVSIPSNSTALLSFYRSQDDVFPTSLDSIYFTVSTDGGNNWTRILPGFQRYNVAATTPLWRLESVSLTPYSGQTIQLGFEGTSQYGNAIGLDDINITVSSLPVTLLEFEAMRNGSVNNLKWSTSQELNSSRFMIERSMDGRNFTEIGSVAAAGFSTDTRNYRFTDANPVKGINYYRLRMVDIDNTYKYSAIKNVRNLGTSEISFSPNPVQQFIRLDIDAEKTERATVRITDMSGKLVYNGSINVINGSNQASINTEKLSSGTYILSVQLSQGNMVRKFTKL